MVGTDDPGNFADLLRPGNLQQEIEAVNHVRFDLRAFVGAQSALGNGKIANLLRRQERPFETSRVAITLARYFVKPVEFSLRKQRRLVSLEDHLEAAFHLGPADAVLLFERRDAGQRLR